ncbi:MAG: dihydrodipicolinate synthase family protein [Acidimicrobiia bacterium]|nr:dihydrodipicolinate synthase family protein [Acidimicrobiia bacterium]
MASVPFLMPALVTPFDEVGEIDFEAHRRNVKKLWKAGIRGFLIAGSTGEGPYLEPGERAALIEVARDQLGKKAHLICGVAAETVRQAQAMIQEATAGADSVLVITPTTLTRNRPQYVEAYYRELADTSPLPVLLYSVPSVTAFELPEDQVSRLSDHPNIVGMKDSGGHPVRLQRIIASVPPKFRLFTGSTQAVTLALAAGAYGAITASTNYVPKKVLETVNIARTDPIKARPLQAEISRIAAAVELHGVPGVKFAAKRAGMSPGFARKPLSDLGEAEQEELRPLFD